MSFNLNDYIHRSPHLSASEYASLYTINIPADVVAKYPANDIADAFRNVQLSFPYKRTYLLNLDYGMVGKEDDSKDKEPTFILKTRLYDLYPYVCRRSNAKVSYPTTHWSVKELATETYRGDYLTFVSNDKVEYEAFDCITDIYTEDVRMSAKRIDKYTTPRFMWSFQTEIVVLDCIKKYKAVTNVTLRDTIWEYGYEANSFKVSLAKSVYAYFDARRILDISAGWGDRLVAAIAHYAERYVGYDPNLALKRGHDNIIRDLAPASDRPNSQNRFEVRYEPFESADLGKETFDLVFTSPPYYNLEIYTELAGQSIITYPSFDEWLVRFLFASLRKAWRVLDTYGTMVIHISDYHKTHYVEAMVLFVLGWCECAEFNGVIGSVGTSKKARPMWVFYKRSKQVVSQKKYRDLMKTHYEDAYRLL